MTAKLPASFCFVATYVGDYLKTVNFAKCYNERYGTYFTYDMRISVPCVCDDGKTRSVICKETRHLGQFGLLYMINNKLCNFAVIGDFPDIELITPLHLDSFDFRKKYNLYKNDGFYYNGDFYDKDFLIGSYIKDAGQMMFKFVTDKIWVSWMNMGEHIKRPIPQNKNNVCKTL